jgi:predicted transcriptional regulator
LVITETPEQINERVTEAANIVRAGLAAAASDIMEGLLKADVPDAAAVMMIGARMFLAETHESIADQIGANKANMRHHLLETVGSYFDAYAAKSLVEKVQG